MVDVKLPRPPRTTDPPEPTMPLPGPPDNPDGHVNEVPLRPRLGRRRRALMGDIVAGMGPAAGVNLAPPDPGKAAAAEEHRALVKRYTKGGRPAGERRGYGVAAHVEPEAEDMGEPS